MWIVLHDNYLIGVVVFKRAVVCIFVGSLAFASSARAECSVTEVQKKAEAFALALQTLVEKDQDKYIKTIRAMEQDLPALQESNDLDVICKFYDDWIEKVK